MALNQSTLETKIRELIDPDYSGFIDHPNTKLEGVNNWATAYDIYALDAQDLSGDVLLTANKAGFVSALLDNMPDPVYGTSIAAATAFELAFVAYWTGATFAILHNPLPTLPCPNIGGTGTFSTETTSIVSSVIPDVLKNLLLVELSEVSSDGAAKAASLAAVFHVATISAVKVTITGADAEGTPITNTCTIH
jgi:hypothetical protein